VIKEGCDDGAVWHLEVNVVHNEIIVGLLVEHALLAGDRLTANQSEKNVRYGSEADIPAARRDVGLVP
jgi:hypothetical protein